MMAEAKKDKVTAQKTTAKKTVVRKSTEKKASEKVVKRTVGIKKEYLKSKNVCSVTFTLPKIAASDAKNVCIVGDFNNWNIRANPMKKLKNGDYTVKLDLEPGKEYQFRYFINESKWENDWNADKYVKSLYGDSDNSVVMTY
jgi:1,4-alpha-glucan branching enzyme